MREKLASWITVPVLVSLFFGGLAGNVFSWWIHREPPLSVAYSISTTGTGSDATAYSIVPNLTVKIGERSVPALYTHVITLIRSSGYGESIDVAATFKDKTEIFGGDSLAPSPLHHITCSSLPAGLKCTLGPLDGRGEYRLVLATDNKEQPEVTTAGKNITLGNYQEVAKASKDKIDVPEPVGWLIIVGVIVFGILAIFFRKSTTPTLDDLQKHLTEMQSLIVRMKNQ
jgi:hypothetical protein